MKLGFWVGIPVVLLILWVGKLYREDSAMIEQAILVQEYLKDYCRSHGSYPESETLEKQFPALFPDGQWFYWPDDALAIATFQYPMSLPNADAPGRSKVSEFLPIIYSYAVRHPCEGLIQTSSVPH